jgi:SAM-dependent methyltransferase
MMKLKTPNYRADVRAQYEQLPYPPVNPQDERVRLQHTWLETLPLLNHYCFQGRQSFRDGFRVLVAGGGTGAATIFLAEQLRATNAQIVHLDFSRASTKIAQERAALRGLGNIVWVHDSLLNVADLGLGKFDYINCSGVLHHLDDPDAGLCALKAVLAEGGSIGLMLYGAIGRTGIYHMQQMLRLLNDGVSEDQKLAHARQLLAVLPASNWFKRGEDLYVDHHNGDAGIYDMLLHRQDRAYTVPELFAWLVDGHGFNLVLSDVERGRFPYLPAMMMGRDSTAVHARAAGLPLRDQYAMGELLRGDLITHTFYLTATSATVAPYGDANCIPFFFYEPLTGAALELVFTSRDGGPITLHHPHLGLTVQIKVGPHSCKIIRHIDGKRTFQQIFDLVRADLPRSGLFVGGKVPDNAALFADFAQAYDALNAIERLLLRYDSGLA